MAVQEHRYASRITTGLAWTDTSIETMQDSSTHASTVARDRSSSWKS